MILTFQSALPTTLPPMTDSYVGSSYRGSIRSCGFQSSAASPASTHHAALLSMSSIYSLVPDHNLFTTAASVVPKLRAVVDQRMEKHTSNRRRSVFQSKQSLSCWIVKKQHHGATINEFDRAKVPSTKNTGHSNGLHRSNSPANIRHTMIESRGSLHPCDVFFRDHTYSASETRKLLHWPRNDPTVTYAVSTQVTVNCRLEEARSMLFSHEALQFDASMSALFGARKYKRGKLLLSHEFNKNQHMDKEEGDDATYGEDEDWTQLSQPGWVALQSVVLRSRRSLNPMTVAKPTSRRQRLCFAVYSQHCPNTNEAFYTMRTLPMPIHNHFTGSTDQRSSGQAIRDDVDHIAAGYHLTSSYSDLNGHQTSVIMTAYVCNSPTSPTTDGSRMSSTLWPKSHSSDRSVFHRRQYAPPVANAEAKYVVNLLANATTSFEQLVHRRRLGSQPCLYMPSCREAAPSDSCAVCVRPFGLLRPQRVCHLCAERVCRECSRKFDIEPVARRVRRTRICFTCVAKVDASVFQAENPLLNASLSKDSTTGTTGPRTSACDRQEKTKRRAIAEISTDEMEEDQPTESHHTAKAAARSHQGQMHRNRSSSAVTSSTSFSSTNGRQLADALFSNNVSTRAHALEVLRHVVKHVTSDPAGATSTVPSRESSTSVFQSQPDIKIVDKYLEARQHLSSISLHGNPTATESSTPINRDRSRSFYNYQEETPCQRYSTTSNDDQCFASSVINNTRPSIISRPWQSHTTVNLATELDSDEELDSAALDAICEVAALRMRCSIAYIVALNGTHSSQTQRVVGMFGASRSWTERMTMCPMSLMAHGKPFVVKDPLHDAQLENLQLVQEIGVRFFAGCPIKSPDNAIVACLCTISAQARDNVSLEDLRAMHALSKLASDLFEEEVNPYTPRNGT